MTAKEFLHNYPKKKNESNNAWFRRLAKISGMSEKTFSSRYYKKQKVKKHTDIKYHFDRKERILKTQLKEKDKLYKKALENLDITEKRLNTLLYIKSLKPEYRMPVDNEQQDLHKAIPILIYSDWHVEETVSPESVNGLNEFNLEISDKRIKKCFNRSHKLVNHLKTYYNIDTLYILLNGDIISGYIHEELKEANQLSPTQAIKFAKERIIAGLEHIKTETNVKKIIVQCNYGNHGRTTLKKRFSETAYKNSYEWLMYSDIADYFSKDETFEFHIAKSLISYFTFLYKTKKFVLRTFHGDNIRFAGGVGGITIPLNKMILRLDQNRAADYNIIGHFHTLFEANKKTLVNGSLIGYNAFASDLGFEFETPKQGLLLLDLERMEIRAKYTINCD